MAALIPYKPKGEPGPRPSWFKQEMLELIRELSPKFRQFANDVFDNVQLDPHVTKEGILFTQANVRDKIVLMATIAKLAGLQDADNALREPLQKVIDQVQAIKLLQELNYGAHARGNGNGSSAVVGNGHTETPSDRPPT